MTIVAAPAAPAITSFSTDSGVVGDHITNDNTLTLTGTAVAGSTVKVYDGATLLGSTAADSSGAWNYTTAALADGNHNLTAIDTDAAGNTSVASSALALTIDTTAPATPTATVSVGTGTFAYLSGTAEAGSTVSILSGANGTLVGTALAGANGAWSFMKFGATPTTFTLTATDAAGNNSAAPHGPAPANAAAPDSAQAGNAFVFSSGIGTSTSTDLNTTVDVTHDPMADAAAAIHASFATVAAHAGADIAITAEAVTLQNTALSHLTINNFHLV